MIVVILLYQSSSGIILILLNYNSKYMWGSVIYTFDTI